MLACGGDAGPTFTGEPTGRIAFVSDRDGDSEIHVMNGDGSRLANLTQNPARDYVPSWSPGGDRLAFASTRDGQPDLYLMDADGGNVQRLTDDGAAEGNVVWSPDGGRIAFSSARDQSQGLLWVANADGSEATAVLAAITPSGPEVACAGGFPGSWFPDGETILYRGSQGGISALQICSVRSDGSDIKVILSEEKVSSAQPRLSPDAKHIVFRSNRVGNFEIYVMTAAGKKLRRLTHDPGEDAYPVWAPDGQWIAFVSDREGDFNVYVVRPDGSDLRQLTSDPAVDSAPTWGP